MRLTAAALLLLAVPIVADDAGRLPGGVKREIFDALEQAGCSVADDDVRHTIRRALTSDDRKALSALDYMETNSRWIDWRPIGDEILDWAGQGENRESAGRWLDVLDLVNADKATRVRVYRTAIESGSVRLSRGKVIELPSAMYSAALDGIGELLPLIEERRALAFWWQRDSIVPMLRLTSGALDREDALRVAGERLSAMSDDAIDDAMQSSGFRTAAPELARSACTADPFRNRRGPSCAGYRDVAKRQEVYRSQLKRKSPLESSDRDWVASLIAATQPRIPVDGGRTGHCR